MNMRLSRAVSGVLTGALAVLLMAISASAAAAAARALVAPVSAGPPHPTRVAHLDLNGFFPRVTKIHVGDSVSWSINGSRAPASSRWAARCHRA
jgi:plastocyanin